MHRPAEEANKNHDLPDTVPGKHGETVTAEQNTGTDKDDGDKVCHNAKDAKDALVQRVPKPGPTKKN